MTTTPPAAPSITTSDRAPLRLAVRHPVRGVPLEGAWHPRSRDLQREAADLVDHFPRDVGRVARLLFSRPDWDAEPGVRSVHRIRASRGPVKVGSFPADDTKLLVVRLGQDRSLRLLVVPAEVDEARGRRILEQAARTDNQLGVDELLALA